MTPSWLASSVATTSGVDGFARWADPVRLPEAGAVADCACSVDRPTVSAMSVAILVFMVFSFYSLRPAARLGQEAVDEAMERSESWGAAKRTAHRLARLLAADGRLRDWRGFMAALSGLGVGFMFFFPHSTRGP